MNAKNEMIIIKGEIKTSDVQSCKYNNVTNLIIAHLFHVFNY